MRRAHNRPPMKLVAAALAGVLLGGLLATSASAATAAPSGDDDLALGRLATQSSTAFDAPADRAVDGSTDGAFWDGSLSHTDQEAEAWWQVDLEADQRIGSIVVWNRTDCCISRLSDFYVLVSEQPFQSTDLNQARQQPGVSAYHVDRVAGNVTLPVNRKGRYVRVQLAGTGYLALAEVQVLQSPAPPAPAYRNVGLGARTTQSSVLNGGVPTRAQDGITDGRMADNSVSQTAVEQQPWWQADLRSTEQLSSIVVWNRTDCCADRLSDFYVLVSEQPFGSTNLDEARRQLGVRSWHVDKMNGPSKEINVGARARYVRVQLAGTNTLTLAEVQIFNTERPSVPDVRAHIQDNQFGMFIHYGLGTYTNEQWATPNTPPSVFNPTNLDTDQWAQAAVSAGMKYGVLTTKHHDGFALWDTASNNYDVAASPYHGDVVRSYVDSFRKAGLGVGLYYSIWDRTNGENLELVINQLRELLTNYGPINQIWFDQWQAAGYTKIPYETVRDFVRNVSPQTVIVNNDKNDTLATTDIVEYEDGRPPAGLQEPTQMSDMISTSNWDWFHTKDSVDPRTTEDIVGEETYERDHGYQYLLNVGPSADGRMDQVYVDRLAEVGAALATQ
jgi:hypothetical protein